MARDHPRVSRVAIILAHEGRISVTRKVAMNQFRSSIGSACLRHLNRAWVVAFFSMKRLHHEGTSKGVHYACAANTHSHDRPF